VEGQVKTRMQPFLTPLQSAELAAEMLAVTMRKVAASWSGKCVLAASPDTELPLFQELCSQYGFETESQVSGNLGDRMAYCLENGLKNYGCAAVMGCDTPHISESVIRQFHDSMINGENVVGPAVDGGFYFLGLNSFSRQIFSDIVWGENRVLSALRENARDNQIELCEYSPLRDIDNWDDLCWLASVDPFYNRFIFSPGR
jgi:rSAM/selenodomain-associated transferase 1